MSSGAEARYAHPAAARSSTIQIARRFVIQPNAEAKLPADTFNLRQMTRLLGGGQLERLVGRRREDSTVVWMDFDIPRAAVIDDSIENVTQSRRIVIPSQEEHLTGGNLRLVSTRYQY